MGVGQNWMWMNEWRLKEGKIGWKEGIWCVDDDDANNDNDNDENNYSLLCWMCPTGSAVLSD